MKTRAFTAALVCLATSASAAMAEDTAFGTFAAIAQPGLTLTVAAQPAVTCLKLEQPADSCVIVSKPIVNYVAPAFNVVDLNGAWAGPGDERPYIYLYGDPQYGAGYTIMVDMSLLSRPDGFGYMLDATTIVVVFPDDRDYTGTIENGSTIRWSNNSVWTKR